MGILRKLCHHPSHNSSSLKSDKRWLKTRCSMTNQNNPPLPRFHRKELVLGEQLEYGSEQTKFYAISGVHLRHRQPENEHPMRNEVAMNPHMYAAMLVSDETMDQANILANVSHTHIASVRGFYTTSSYTLLVVDRMMCTLADCLENWASRKRPPPLLERLYVAHHISAALAYLHDQNVVFGELHPENIGFDTQGHLKLFDFNTARKVNRYEKKDSTTSTMSSSCDSFSVNSDYAAPEVKKGRPANCASDVFGFTMVLWELLMLMPGSSEESLEYVHMIQESSWPLWAQDIVSNGLCPNEKERTNMRAIQLCLRKVLKQEEQKERYRKKSILQ